MARQGIIGNGYGQPVFVNETGTNQAMAGSAFILQTSAAAGAGRRKVWNGTSWVVKPTKVWNGSSWVTKPTKFWNGTAWIT